MSIQHSSARTGLLAALVWVAVALVCAVVAQADGLPVVGAVDTTRDGIISADSQTRYLALGGGDRTTVLSVDVGTGRLTGYAQVPGDFVAPGVTYDGDTSGLSFDESTLVLIRPRTRFPQNGTQLIVLRTERPGRPLLSPGRPHEKSIERIPLDGDYSFDAISPDGTTVYLVEYPNSRDPNEYQVVAYDLVSGRLDPEPILPANDPGEEMRGYPLSRATGADGRWEYTLYDGGALTAGRGAEAGEPFVHALDTVEGATLCIDLPWLEGTNAIRTFGAVRLELSEDSSTIGVVDSSGNPLGSIDTTTHLATEAGDAPAAEPATDSDHDDSWILVPAGAGIAGLGALAIALGFARRRRTPPPGECTVMHP